MHKEGKVAVITGGASGLGLATALVLQAAGMQVALLDFNQDALMQVEQEHGFKVYHCDVSDADQALACMDSIAAQWQAIHVLVNCAGIAPAKRIVGRDGAQPLEDFSRVIQVNLLGTFNLLRLAAKHMSLQEPVNEQGERGVIINTASVAAYEGQIGQAAYSASKGGVAAMTLPAARELARFGIRVMSIAPGIMHTPMMAAMPEKVQDALHASVPFPTRMGNAQEYANLVAHIIENSYLNGEVIRLDGAIRMPPK